MKKAARGEWKVITLNNGHPTYSLTERNTVTGKTRKVNPNNGRIQRR